MTRPRPSARDLEVLAPNFKRRLSGVTSTIVQLVPQQSTRLRIASCGPDVLPADVPRLPYRAFPALWRAPQTRPTRIWHARRNTEMLAGVVMRDVLRMPLSLVFTSASQRVHTGWTRWLIGRMDAVIATSARTAAYLRVPNSVVMHGIDTARFSPPADKGAAKTAVGLPSDKKIAGCFGRIRHQKGTDVFVDAMCALLPRHLDWIAVVAGRTTGEHKGFEADLKARVARAGLETRILFVGEHSPIDPWYKGLDLFVAPQRWEGFGLTPLEAMACGVPVVATTVGAFPELLAEGETGRLVEPGSPDAIASAADAIMSDEALRMRMGEHASAHARAHFDLSREAREIEAVYEAVWRKAERRETTAR